MKANRIKKMSTDSRGIFILKKNISCSLFAVCRREFRLFFCYFDLLPLLLFVPIGLTWDTQCNITAFKLLWKKMMIFWAQSDCMQIWQSTGVYRLQRFSFSIEFSWMFFTLRSGGGFFFCLFSVSVWIFPILMHWKGDTTKHIQRELNVVIVRAFDVSRLQEITIPKT